MSRRRRSLYQKARSAYRQETLARICTLPEMAFGEAFGMQTVTVTDTGQQPGDGEYYHFRDNGASVLAVAHLDTVVSEKRRKPRFSSTQSGPLVTCGALDDRLGAYVILSMLPALGISHDWLLTTGEESCQSTARYFRPEKAYNWIIEFDRGSTDDVVMYQYEDVASRQAVTASGAIMDRGSYSDICDLEHLEVKAFNWGVGYQGRYHSEKGFAYLSDTCAMVTRYLRFHAQNAETAMPHERVPYASLLRAGNGLDCEACGAFESVSTDTLTCAYCQSCWACEEGPGFCQCHVPAQAADEAAS